MVRPSVRSTTRSSSVTRTARARAIASTVKVLMPGLHELVAGVEVVFARLIHYPKIPFLPGRRVLEHLVDLARLQIVAAVVPNAKDKIRLCNCLTRHCNRSRDLTRTARRWRSGEAGEPPYHSTSYCWRRRGVSSAVSRPPTSGTTSRPRAPPRARRASGARGRGLALSPCHSPAGLDGAKSPFYRVAYARGAPPVQQD